MVVMVASRRSGHDRREAAVPLGTQWARGPGYERWKAASTCGFAGSRDWTRTSNLPVNSRLLCQLSYAGSPGSTPGSRQP